MSQAFDLSALLETLEANAGAAPKVNPPEAAGVVATQTAPEVAGEPEPPPPPEEAPAPTEKPADVVAAENAKPKRRTAAVVQAELDALQAKYAELEEAYNSGGCAFNELKAKYDALVAGGASAEPNAAIGTVNPQSLCLALTREGFEVTLRYVGASK